jgi:hypothetical protein
MLAAILAAIKETGEGSLPVPLKNRREQIKRRP